MMLSLSAQETKQSRADRVQIKGYGQAKYEVISGESAPISNSFVINKAELSAIGLLTDNFKVGASVQFHGPVMLKDLYMQYTFMPELKVRVGQFKTPFSHENQVAPARNILALGGSIPTIFFAGVGMDPLYSGTSGRDMGVELSGDALDNLLSYRLVAMNGQGLNSRDWGNSKMLGGSLYVRPVKGLSLHTSYLGGKQSAMAAGRGIEKGETYTRHRLSGGVIFEHKYVSVSTEYMYGRDNSIASQGCYLKGAIHLPKRVDLAFAGDYMTPDLSKKAFLLSATAGVNYWFYKLCRIQLQYRYATTIQGVALFGLEKQHQLIAQMQFAF